MQFSSLYGSCLVIIVNILRIISKYFIQKLDRIDELGVGKSGLLKILNTPNSHPPFIVYLNRFYNKANIGSSPLGGCLRGEDSAAVIHGDIKFLRRTGC